MTDVNDVYSLLKNAERRSPEAIAILDVHGKALDYRLLLQQVKAVAECLNHAGIGRGDRVATVIQNGPEAAVGCIGVSASAVCAPLNSACSPAEFEFYLRDLAPAALIVDQRLSSPVARIAQRMNVPVITMAVPPDGLPGTFELNHELRTTDPKRGGFSHAYDAAMLLYTTGTTSRPKLVSLTHASLCRSARLNAEILALTPADRCLNVMPLFHIHGLVFAVLSSLGVGSSVVCSPSFQASHFLEWLDALRPTWYTAAPSIHYAVLARAAEKQEAIPRSLRFIRSGASALPASIMKELEQVFAVPVIEAYAMTESGLIAINKLPPQTRKPNSAGVPIGCQLAVMDDQNRPLPPGQTGRIAIRGGSVIQAYENNPEANLESFVGGWFYTGDEGKLDSDGYLFLTGRTSETINRGGEKISPSEIDQVLMEHPAVLQATAFAVPHPGLGQQVAACVVVRSNFATARDELLEFELQEFAAQRLAQFKVPYRILFVAEIPKGPTGKPQRKGLAAMLGLSDLAGTASPENSKTGIPRNATEERLTRIWKEVLERTVGVEDDFFQLGGDSISAAQLIARLGQEFGVNLPVFLLFRTPTVRAQAEWLEQRRNGNDPKFKAFERIPRPERLPLSYGQQRLWFLQEYEQNKSHYNVPLVIRLKGSLNIGVLEWAITRIVRRHESLRTSFQVVEGNPVQVIGPAEEIRVPLWDISGIAEKERSERRNRIIEEQIATAFDLGKAPLLRAALVREAEEDHVLVLVMHHIVSDGWSIGVLQRELGILYGAYARGEEDPLEELGVQYGDYAVWQREWMRGEELGEQAEYWKEKLRGAVGLLEVPRDHERPRQQEYAGGVVGVELDEELTGGLKQLSRRHGVTLHMTLLAGWAAVLGRLTGEEEMVIGTPVANRGRVEVEGLIGFFVNTLALRLDMSGGLSVKEMLRRVKEEAVGAQQHQDMPFEQVVEVVQPERSLGHSPLFQVMFAWQNAPVGRFEAEGLEAERVEWVQQEVAKFDLTLGLEEEGGRIRGGLGYARSLFERKTVERYVGYLKRVLEGMVREEEAEVDGIRMMSEEEREQVVRGWNQTAAEYGEKCVHELFEEQVERTPQAVAVVCGEKELSYEELNRRANRLAHYLRGLGVQPDTRVGICCERGIEMMVGLLGVLKSGAAYVPLDPTYPPDRLHFMVQDSSPEVLLTQSHLLDRFSGIRSEMILVDMNEMAVLLDAHEDCNLERVPIGLGPKHLAYVIYTSGSTGMPKAVMIEHGSAVNFIRWAQESFSREVLRRTLFSTSLNFDLAVYECFVPISSGGTVKIVPNVLEQPMPDVTLINTVPSAMTALVQANAIGPQVQVINLAGEPLKRTLVERIFATTQVQAVCNLYGPSETTTYSSWVAMKRGGPLAAHIGKPIANTQIYILDRCGEPAPIGVAGEIYIGGVGVARGYLNRPELTAERFVPNPYAEEAGARMYRTGDLGKWLADGNIEFLGRNDFQVKLRGFRIELGEIEARLQEHERVKEAVVIARENETGEKQLVAYYTERESGSAGSSCVGNDELRNYLRERLPEYMTPGAFVRLNELPRTANGKLDRKALPKPEAEACGKKVYEEPQGETEREIAKIWGGLLGRERVGRQENFFQIGGHSLLAMQVMMRIRGALGIEIPLRWLFEAPKIAKLAARVDEEIRKQNRQQVSAIGKADRERELPLSFAQQRLWFLHEYEENKSLYNVTTVVRFKGKLDVKALENAVNHIIRRHESLRTRFALGEDGNPVQVIERALPFHMATADLTGMEKAQQKGELRRIVQEQAEHTFDLFTGPLLQGVLTGISEAEHVFVLVTHHIVSDGWSFEIFMRELAGLYESYTTNTTADLPELSIQYADYAAWQREWLQDEVLEEQLKYWRKQLATPSKPLGLSIAKNRLAAPDGAGDRYYFEIDAATVEQLQQAARKEAVTLFMLLLSAFKILLYRYSGQTDLAVGTPVAGRSRQELEGLIGCFVNTLVLRTDLAGDPTVAQLLARVREVALDAYANQDVPFEKLVEELEPQRDSKRTPFFETMLVLQNQPRAEWKLPDLEVQQELAEINTAKFDLTLSCTEQHGGGLRARFEYRSQLFDECAIERMSRHFEKLLREMLAHPDSEISELEYLTEAEQEQLLVEWNRPPAERASQYCIHHLFERQAECRPDATAVVYEDQQLSYRELNEKANQLAHFLRKSGVGPEARVGLCLERSLELVIAVLGVLKAGAAYVPIDPQYPSQRIGYVLKDSAATLVITSEKLLSRFDFEFSGTSLCIDADADVIEQSDKNNPIGLVDPQNTAYVIYTSGSTGEPKGVMVPHCNVARLLAHTHHWFNFNETDTWTLFHSYAFDFSVWELWGALCYGGRLLVVPHWKSRSPQAFRELLWSEKATVLNQTPSAFSQLMQADSEADRSQNLSLRLVIFGGEALHLQGLQPWFDKYGDEQPQLVNMYGITETTVHVTYRRIRKQDTESPGSFVGWRIPDLQLYVLDEHMRPVAVGVPGELYVGGAGLARGYLNRPALTAERFVPNPFSKEPGSCLYRTGDLGRFLESGDIDYLGRADHQVKIRGFRIELGEIRAVLETFPGVKQAVVVAASRKSGEKRLIGYYVPAIADLRQEDLQHYLRSRLPEYMVPSALVSVEEIPLTTNGKIDFKALPEPDVHVPNTRTYVAPRTAKEALLAVLWGDMLEIEDPGVENNFFDSGGDSIISIRLLTTARQQGLHFSLIDLFENPTIGALAKVARLENRIGPAKTSSPDDERTEHLLPGIEAAYPMTQMQAGMMFQHELDTREAHYLNFTSLHLRAPWNLAAMQKVITDLMRRHPILRTSFDMGTYAVPMQMVHASVKVPLWVEDLRYLSGSEQEQALAEWENAQKKRRFDVTNPPLFCIHIHLRSDEAFQLSIVEHHAILDGWSVAVLQSELLRGYAAEIQGLPEKPGKPLHDVFRAYVQLEQEALQSQASPSYWQEQLNGSQALNLTRRSDNEGAAETAYRTRISLPQDLCNKLKQAARLAGVPVKNVLLAAHMRVLGTLSGLSDILTGLVMHGRPEMQDADCALGLFLNTLPLRLQLEDCSWLELAQKSFQAEREMLPHRFYPMASIIQQTGSAPLETLFNFVHFHVLDNMDIAPIEILGKNAFAHTEFALAVNCSQSNRGIDITLLFQPSAFTETRAQEITAYYQTAVVAIGENPQQRHGACPLLSQRELQQVLTEWNNTETETATKRLHQFFEEQVEKTPQATAVECRGNHLTYEELNRQANAIAMRLQDYAVGPEARVGVCLDRGTALVSALIGTLKAGGAYVALDPAYPQSRLQYIIDDSQIQLIVTQEDLAQRFSGVSIPVMKVETGIAATHLENSETQLTGSNLAYVIYTSGSTGQPKGVAITHDSAAVLMHWARSVFATEELQGVCAGTSVSFDLSVFEIFAPLSWGGTVILTGNTLELAETAKHSEVRLINTVPSVMAELLRSQLLPATVQTINLAGEALSQELVEQLYKYPNVKRVLDLYGPSEDTTYSTYALRHARGKPTIGRPIANTKIYVLNEAMQPQPVGVAGEIYIGGSGLARGYLGKPELTAEKFLPDPFGGKAGRRLYRTGDLARWNEDGNLEFLGRIDGQVKVRGYRIECGEVESTLRQCPGIREAVVSLRGDEDDKRLAAYLVADDPYGLEVDSIRRLLREKLPEFMVPSWIIVLKSLPLNSNGKIDRKALAETHFETAGETRQKYEAPANPAEELVAGIWAEVLKLERVGRNDDFFVLGGHSLLVMQVIARIRHVFRQAVPLNSLFEAPVLADFVNQLTLQQKKPGRLEKIAKIFLAGDEQKEAATGACL